jgi:hypothetical protein
MTTTETLPATAVETIDTYVAAWNETDPAARSTLVERALGADVWYRDPMLEADGRAAFDAMVAAVQAQFPGLVMRRTSDVDAHHDLVRFTWALGAPGADPAVAGVDVAKFDGDGRLHRIIGFTPAELA